MIFSLDSDGVTPVLSLLGILAEGTPKAVTDTVVSAGMVSATRSAQSVLKNFTGEDIGC